MKHFARLMAAIILCSISLKSAVYAQAAECPYPIILLHGWTGDQTSFSDSYTDNFFENVFGTMSESQVFYSMNNATTSSSLWGGAGTNDDDVLVNFSNENNVLPAACVYTINQDNSIQTGSSPPVLLKNSGDAIGFTESDSNESALYKQGYTLNSMITQVLAANPTKDKVILIGHSMGGLAIREYLQRSISGTPTWWVDPNNADGHQVIKAMTIVTPHRGSNTLGALRGEEESDDRDGNPDINSEAVRDMRYKWSCGFLGLGECTAAYLYGGDEDAGWGWWNEDVNCDGDENDNNVIGINIKGTDQGFSNEWDGTYANPAMPLPTNLRYTYLTSNWFGGLGDGAVAMDRQWIFQGTSPSPTDGIAGRLTDTLLTYVFHTDANDDADMVVRGIDEGDYPAFVWDIQTETDYINLSNYRAGNVPEGNSTQDPDWFRFDIPTGYAGDVRIDVVPNSGVSTRLGFFGGSPAGYTSHGTISAKNIMFPVGSSAEASLTVLNADLNAGGENYFRLYHSNVDFSDWRQPLIVSVHFITVLPVDWSSITAKLHDESTSEVNWTTSLEENLSHYEIEFSTDGVHFAKVGTQEPLPQQNYSFIHAEIPYGQLYYRIKSIDYDGVFSYSDIAEISNKPDGWVIRNIYPMPADEYSEINIYTPTEGSINLQLYNSQGQLLRLKRHELVVGENYLNMAVSDLPSGIYLLLIEGQGQQVWQKMAKR